jgi:hypothetical protein
MLLPHLANLENLKSLDLQDEPQKWHYFPNSYPPTTTHPHPPTHPSHHKRLLYLFFINQWLDLTDI